MIDLTANPHCNSLCIMCNGAEAEVVDIDHGPICFPCHDGLDDAERRPSFLISPNLETTTHDLL